MLKLEGLRKRYGNNEAVRGIDLEVSAGEIFGFLGPNGAGKTTTIKMIVGLALPTEGRVLIGGHDVTRKPVAAKKLLGYVPDRPHTYEKLRGREFLEFVAGLHGIDEEQAAERAMRLLAQFALVKAGDEMIESYSHGMRQKLILSAALIHEPKLLVVDEPMVGLDPRGARQIREILREQAARGGAIFLSTHSLNLAEDTCTRIGIVRDGKLVALGSSDELRALAKRPGSPLEEVFIELTEESSEAGV